MRKAIIFISIICIILGCSSSPKSRVDYFGYGGYGDTIVALLYGKVFEIKNDTFTPVNNVMISDLNHNLLATSNTDGQFEIGFNKGAYNLKIEKVGYQTLYIKKFISVPDQLSTIKIILEKGNSEQVYTCPKWQ